MKVLVVTTGDEVGTTGPAGIPDSNGPYLEAFLRTMSVDVSRVHAKDNADELLDALSHHGEATLIVTVGGVSMGAKDLIPELAKRAGFEPVFHKVPIQPGKPVFFARKQHQTALLGLPGNPVSVIATSHLFLRPLILRCMNLAGSPWELHPLAAAFRNAGQRRLFLPAWLRNDGLHPVPWNGSGDLLAAAAGDGLIDVAPCSELSGGAVTRFLPYQGSPLGTGSILPPRA
jgi:molybdopterin molybdotransferase